MSLREAFHISTTEEQVTNIYIYTISDTLPEALSYVICYLKEFMMAGFTIEGRHSAVL